MGELAAVAQHASVQLVGQEHKKGLTASWGQPEFHPENVTETLKTEKKRTELILAAFRAVNRLGDLHRDPVPRHAPTQSAREPTEFATYFDDFFRSDMGRSTRVLKMLAKHKRCTVSRTFHGLSCMN